MTASLFAILILLAIVLIWLDGARARELATAVVDELCRRRGYQLLDETVALARLGLARTGGGLRLRRLFQFDYSVEGVGRRQGHILLHGSTVVRVNLAEPQDSPAEPLPPAPSHDGDPAPPASSDNKVIPFRRRH